MAQSTMIRHRTRPGFCQLRSAGCEGQCSYLEWHHESYKPNPKQARKDGRGMDVCHKCHFKIHFGSRLLTLEERKKLILMRYPRPERITLLRDPAGWESEAKAYVPPRKE